MQPLKTHHYIVFGFIILCFVGVITGSIRVVICSLGLLFAFAVGLQLKTGHCFSNRSWSPGPKREEKPFLFWSLIVFYTLAAIYCVVILIYLSS